MSSSSNAPCTTSSATRWSPSCKHFSQIDTHTISDRTYHSLRHVEYYRGILFLTTNRVKTFDEAFLSRIHVALHFQELSADARVQVWRAFLEKMSATDAMSDEQLRDLGQRPINGRQIKNAVRTACSLAVSRKEPLKYGHIVETLDAMHEFTMEFRAMNAKLETTE